VTRGRQIATNILAGFFVPLTCYVIIAVTVALLRSAWIFSTEPFLFGAMAVCLALGFWFMHRSLKRWALLVGIVYVPLMLVLMLGLSAVVGGFIFGEGP
jgi:hypothetical protein